jgi:hypothetical protein
VGEGGGTWRGGVDPNAAQSVGGQKETRGKGYRDRKDRKDKNGKMIVGKMIMTESGDFSAARHRLSWDYEPYPWRIGWPTEKEKGVVNRLSRWCGA